jgi:hypothetical protein
MNTIKLNTLEFPITSFNRNTYFTGESMNSNASFEGTDVDITALSALGLTEITTVQIYHNEELIYDLQNIHGKIDNFSEYLREDKIAMSINMSFT